MFPNQRGTSPNTTLSGFIVGPGPDSKPMTIDDFGAGPDGVTFTEDDEFFFPIIGAEVFILGLEHIKVVTDENGFFELTEKGNDVDGFDFDGDAHHRSCNPDADE